MPSHSSSVHRRPIALASTIAALLACNFAARAVNKTWDGGSGVDSAWLTAANWDLDAAPVSNDALIFAGATRLGPVNDFAANGLFNGITFNAGAGAFTLSGNAITLTLTGNLTETGGARSITKTGLSTLVLIGTNQWTGATLIQNGTLRIGSLTAFPVNANVTLGSVGNSGVLDLGGFDAYLAGLTVSGTGTANIVGSSGTATDSVLYFANGSSTFRGTIQNVVGTGSRTVRLDVLSGTLALTGVNTFTGGTTIEGGTLSINDDAALGAVSGGVAISGGGKLQAAAEITSARVFTLGAGGGTIDTNGNDVTLDANSTVTGTTLTKIGSGALTLAGIQTYATLNANGGTTHVESALGTGAPTVNVSANIDFSVSQTLAALNIADGAAATFGPATSPAPAPDLLAAAAVPEPGSLGLLMLGALGILGRRPQRGNVNAIAGRVSYGPTFTR